MTRVVLLKDDPLIGQPRGDKWVAELKQRVESGVLKGSRAELDRQYVSSSSNPLRLKCSDSNTDRRHFIVMDGEDIDRFLDRCEDVLLKDREHGPGM